MQSFNILKYAFSDAKKKHGNPSSYNSKRDDNHLNAWNSRKLFTESSAPSVRVCIGIKVLLCLVINVVRFKI